MKSTAVGILAFQGDFAIHTQVFERLGCIVSVVKSPKTLEEIDYLVIPGGESSVIARFIQSSGMMEPLRKFAAEKPVWGTCAGMILLAREIANDPETEPIGLIDMVVERNAFGRQYESFVDSGQLEINGKNLELEMVFIRAPKVLSIGKNVEVLGRWGDQITVVKQGRVIASAFHPELSESTVLQEYFLSL